MAGIHGPQHVGFTRPVTTNQPGAASGETSKPDAANFADLLARQVKFSNHAQKRLEQRQICLTEDGLERLAAAVDKASQRGGRESLVLMDDMAFIVNVKDRLVVTALNEDSRKAGVVTQIDTVVFAESEAQAPDSPAASINLTNPTGRPSWRKPETYDATGGAQ